MDTAVVLVGGRGERLAPLTNNKPKTLVEINGKPMLQYIIEWLKEYGVKHLVLGVAYKKESISEFMKEKKNFGMLVDYSEHTVGGGTAEGFGLAVKRFVKDENFIAMNGDEITNLNLDRLVEKHKKYSSVVTHAVTLFYRGSAVSFDDDGKILTFKYVNGRDLLPMSVGIYVFNRSVLEYIPTRGSIENTAFAALVKIGRSYASVLSNGEKWLTVDKVEELEQAEKELKQWNVH